MGGCTRGEKGKRKYRAEVMADKKDSLKGALKKSAVQKMVPVQI